MKSEMIRLDGLVSWFEGDPVKRSKVTVGLVKGLNDKSLELD